MIDQLRVWQAHLLQGRALDIGAGDGEISLWLATQGYEVDALELDQQRASHLQTLFTSFPIHLHPVDVLEFSIPSKHYSLIIASAVLHFINPMHHLMLAERLVEGLTPGGMLFAAAFTRDDPSASDEDDSEPDRVQHYFHPDELRQLFQPMDVLFYDESRRVAPGSLYGYRAGAILVARRAPEQNRI